MSVFRRFFEEHKQIVHFRGWSSPEKETSYVWFDAPLEIGGVTERGLVLHGGAYSNFPDVHVTFELVARNMRGRRRIALARVDWRSLKGGHKNRPGFRDKGLDRRRVPWTHHHEFELNHDETNGRMKRRLPWARAIEPEPQSFEELKEFVGIHFGINDMDVVDAPPWEYHLFR